MGLDITQAAIADHDVFASIYNPGKLALLVSWKEWEAAALWNPVVNSNIQALRHRLIRIVRDYGMFDRRESPQYYPDAKGQSTVHAAPARKH